MDMSQYRELFLSETREHINHLNQLVVTLEQAPGNRETIDALFREAHSIKGMAASMGFDGTARLAHHLEDRLAGFRSSGLVPLPAIDYLLAGIDLLEGLLDDLQHNRPERAVEPFMREQIGEAFRPGAESVAADMPPSPSHEASPAAVEPAAVAPPDGSRGEELLPVTAATPPQEPALAAALVEEADVFQVMVELTADTPAAAARGILILRELEKCGELMSSTPDLTTLRGGGPCVRIQAWLRTSLAKLHVEERLLRINGVAGVRFIDDRRRSERRTGDEGARTIRVRTDLLDQFINLAGELITQRYVLNAASRGHNWDELQQALVQTGRLIDDLHHHALQARLMPLENITGRLPRIVRDLSRKTGKLVALRINGADVGIDRVVLEALSDPLVHLVRNAVDHGIAREGVVTVSARREKDLVLIEVADDGRGMDPDRLRRKALERGLLSAPQAAALSDREALMLVCQPGFSTAAEVTETSGRGVGMDVVKAAVGNLGGTLDILSAPGQGTRFQLRLPLAIAIIKMLRVSCGGQLLAIPLTRVLRTLDLPREAIGGHADERRFCLDEEDIPLFSLAAMLGLPAGAAGDIAWVVLCEVQGRRVGLQVDRLLGHREAFVKSLGFPLNLLNGLSGATIEGNGQVVCIVDPQPLLENHLSSTPSVPGGPDALS